jgi:hypothetical protein
VNHSHSRITLGWLVSGESVTSKPPGSPKIVLWYAIVPLAMPFGHAFFLNIYIYKYMDYFTCDDDLWYIHIF